MKKVVASSSAYENSRFGKDFKIYSFLIIALLLFLAIFIISFIFKNKAPENEEGILYNIKEMFYLGWMQILDFKNYVSQDLAVRLEIVGEIPSGSEPGLEGGGSGGGSESLGPISKPVKNMSENSTEEYEQESPKSDIIKEIPKFDWTLLILISSLIFLFWFIFWKRRKHKKEESLRRKGLLL